MLSTELEVLAEELRIKIIDMIVEAGSGHPGGSLSATDILTVLWFDEMKGLEAGRLSPDRDRFILSKGHAVPALYAILAQKGFIPEEELKTLRKIGSRLQGHPDRVRLPLVETSTGSLGQGLSVAQGLALGLRSAKKKSRVYCMVGDGETEEGQIWEAAMSAPKFKLSNLCVIQDNNKGQIDGPVAQVMPLEPIGDKWRAFGWHVIEIDGHDIRQISAAFAEARCLDESGGAQPVFILAQTIKGKGVSYMEHKIDWHGAAPKAEEAKTARQEILNRLKEKRGSHA
ncbi:MAG TPA: transketolase [Bdellovibrionales bacterium]|nr:MAG: transketolase [Bdellovibrionales bacterium GWA1_52_35]OFZ42420.1 MAG: transketolase [Bdellovibrionales bacterium GWC1_52_8]HAR41881.1 transketolase [Bdellovibrionales bacterium]HCM40856.1 transketolase [Bdellovibrionales bacterium]